MNGSLPRSVLSLVLAAALAATFAAGNVQANPRDEHGVRAHEHFDARFNHNHAYPVRGAFVGALPHEHFEVVRGGVHYYFAGGVWYAPRPGGFIVVGPPFGVFVPVLPPFYTTVWVGGIPYYYANDAYYVYRGPDQGYEVVAPPDDSAIATTPPPGAPGPDSVPPGAPPPPGAAPGPGAAGPAMASGNIFIYPRNGQSADQQARDKYECHSWASSQTGFDPTQVGGGVPPPQLGAKRADYNRAMAACLDGRGYTVR